MIYAAGEILLVVIGILIALSINSRYQNSQDRKSERVYISSILNDVNQDIETFTGYQESSNNIIETFSNSLKWFKESEPQPTANYVRLVYTLGIARLFENQDVTFREMQSSGKLDLITSEILKTDIIQYYDYVKRAKELSIFLRNYSAEIRNWKFMNSTLDMNSVLSQNYTEILEIDPIKPFPFHNPDYPQRELLIETISTLQWFEIEERNRFQKLIKRAKEIESQIRKEMNE